MRLRFHKLAVCFAVAILLPTLVAEQSASGRRVTDLNNEILRVYTRSVRGGGAGAALRQEAKELLEQRQTALTALLEDSPGEALTAALPAALANDIARAFPESAAQVERHGSLIGILEIEVEDAEDLTSHRMIHRLRVGRDRFRVHFPGDGPRAEAGSLLHVEGMLVGESMVAESADVTTEADAAQSCSSTGVQRLAVIKAKFPGTSPSLANSTLDNWMFGSSGMTVNNYWDEASYGAAWADGDVYPSGSDAWYTLNREYSCTESSALRAAAMDAADGDINFQNYQRVVIVFPKPSSGCSFAGRASVGCWVSSPDGNTVGYALQVLTSMGAAQSAVQLTTHEVGHTFGLNHSSTVDYGSEALGSPSDSGSRSEYGDRYATMGFWTDGHYAAEQKSQLNWLTAQSVSTSGSYVVKPFSNTSGTRALNIKRGSSGTQRLWLEYRRQLGEFNAGPPQYPGNGALIRLGNGNSNSLLLDFTPASGNDFMDVTLNSGQTWEDPYSDLAIEIGSAADSGLQVNVSYGNTPSCATSAPTISVSPSSKSANYPASASYTVTVNNNDSSACSSGSFTMTSSTLFNGSSTSEVSTSLSSSVLTIAPGASKTTTLTATPSSMPAEARNYVVTARAARSNPSQAVEDDAGFTVVPPLQCETGLPSMYLTPSSRTAQFPAAVSYTLVFTNTDNEACDPSLFSISADALFNGSPTGELSTLLGHTALTVSPGATKSTTVTVTPLQSVTSTRTYVVDARISRSNPSQTVGDQSNFVVTPAPICEVGLPTVSLSPTSISREYPNAGNFTLTVVNNDSSVCESSSFSITSSVTGAASTSVGSSTLNIAPGASKTTSVVATPNALPTGTSVHTVTAGVSRSNPSQTVQDDSLFTVVPPAVCAASLPTLSVTPTSVSTQYPTAVSYSVSLTNNDSQSCSGSTFSLTSTPLFNGQPTAEISATVSSPGLTAAPGATATTIILATPLTLPTETKAYVITARASRAGQAGAAEQAISLMVTPPTTEPPPPPPPSPSSIFNIHISVSGTSGSVEIDPLGLTCKNDCSTSIAETSWTPLVLEAVSSGQSCVKKIEGCSASANGRCSLTAARDYNITVEFASCRRGGGSRVERHSSSPDATSTGRGRVR